MLEDSKLKINLERTPFRSQKYVDQKWRKPRFQLEIIQFRSQRAYLTINSSSRVITLNDQRTSLRDIVSVAGKGLEAGIITNVILEGLSIF